MLDLFLFCLYADIEVQYIILLHMKPYLRFVFKVLFLDKQISLQIPFDF